MLSAHTYDHSIIVTMFYSLLLNPGVCCQNSMVWHIIDIMSNPNTVLPKIDNNADPLYKTSVSVYLALIKRLAMKALDPPKLICFGKELKIEAQLAPLHNAAL